jgi:hypothetical protein
MTLNLTLTHRGHVHKFHVSPVARGWNVREEQDATVLYEAHRNDWSHVELDVEMFDARAAMLRRAGWTARPNASTGAASAGEERQ